MKHPSIATDCNISHEEAHVLAMHWREQEEKTLQFASKRNYYKEVWVVL